MPVKNHTQTHNGSCIHQHQCHAEGLEQVVSAWRGETKLCVHLSGGVSESERGEMHDWVGDVWVFLRRRESAPVFNCVLLAGTIFDVILAVSLATSAALLNVSLPWHTSLSRSGHVIEKLTILARKSTGKVCRGFLCALREVCQHCNTVYVDTCIVLYTLRPILLA